MRAMYCLFWGLFRGLFRTAHAAKCSTEAISPTMFIVIPQFVLNTLIEACNKYSKVAYFTCYYSTRASLRAVQLPPYIPDTHHASMPSYNPSQKAAIAQFVGFTQAKDSVAAKVSCFHQLPGQIFLRALFWRAVVPPMLDLDPNSKIDGTDSKCV